MTSRPDLGEELKKIPAEPLLPIEKKLIAWSLGIGIVLLLILILTGRTALFGGT